MPSHDDREHVAEIRIERVLDAARAEVWSAWSDPARLAQWWGPRGFATTTHAWSFTPGGRWRFTMHGPDGPDGTDYENLIEFIEILPTARIVYRHVDEEGCAPICFESIITFEDIETEPGRTLLTMRMRFPNAGERASVIERYGADHGLVETISSLADHLAEQRGGPWRDAVSRARPTERSLIISRVFAAPIELVWRAWTDPSLIAEWFCPQDCGVISNDADFRVGGSYRESMRCGGKIHTVRGVYREIEHERSLVFTHQWETPGSPETLVAVHFTRLDDERTEVRLTQTGLATPESTAGHTEGWSSCFENLAACLSRSILSQE